MKKKLYHFTYDKPWVNEKALRFRRSFDEVKKLLSADRKRKKKG
ncbi:MAG: hypothetical protein SOX32_13285 [Candidatus Choladocola sp.]|nr:hypothetical protein [Candidatus Choladocola sp.]